MAAVHALLYPGFVYPVWIKWSPRPRGKISRHNLSSNSLSLSLSLIIAPFADDSWILKTQMLGAGNTSGRWPSYSPRFSNFPLANRTRAEPIKFRHRGEGVGVASETTESAAIAPIYFLISESVKGSWHKSTERWLHSLGGSDRKMENKAELTKQPLYRRKQRTSNGNKCRNCFQRKLSSCSIISQDKCVHVHLILTMANEDATNISIWSNAMQKSFKQALSNRISGLTCFQSSFVWASQMLAVLLKLIDWLIVIQNTTAVLNYRVNKILLF